MLDVGEAVPFRDDDLALADYADSDTGHFLSLHLLVDERIYLVDEAGGGLWGCRGITRHEDRNHHTNTGPFMLNAPRAET